MPTYPTAIANSSRFFQPGISKVYFLPAVVAATKVPTRTEITAGKDLTSEVAGMSGWAVSGSSIETPDLATRFNSQIPGRTSASDSALEFHADVKGIDVRTVLPRDTTGFIVMAWGGDVATYKADCFPVTVLSMGKVPSLDGNFRLSVQFSITREPAEDFALPANP